MYCSNCGALNDDGANYCGACGSGLRTVGPTPYANDYRGPGSQVHATSVQPFQPYGQFQHPGYPLQVPVRIPSHLAWAIVSIFLFVPTGIVATVYATRVDDSVAAGAYQRALEYSRKAKYWCSLTLGVAVALFFMGAISGCLAVLGGGLAILGG